MMRAIFLFAMVLISFNSFSQSDTIYHYFSDGRISVKIAPESPVQRIWVYHILGDVIYEFENVRQSYSVSNSLKFRPDGSLESVKTHSNPGASMYWYESETVFETDNEPRYQVSYQMPFMTVMDAMGTKYLWNRKEKSWQKQEIAICQPYKGNE